MTRNIVLLSLIFFTKIAACQAITAGNAYDGCASADCLEDAPPNIGEPHNVKVIPEVYHVKRTRQKGAEQTGNAGGIRVRYDYLKRYCFYVGAESFYGSGVLKGHTGSSDAIRSRLKDSSIEGYLGYTFQMKCYPYPAFTPYAGVGYLREVNKFSPPSPLQIKYTTQFRYLAFGFLSRVYLNPCFSIGLNARFRWPWEAKSKVNDSEFGDTHQQIGDSFQYRIELPLVYGEFPRCPSFQFGFTPFYEGRHYGSRENFPFDFYRTTFSIYGFNLQIIYRF